MLIKIFFPFFLTIFHHLNVCTLCMFVFRFFSLIIFFPKMKYRHHHHYQQRKNEIHVFKKIMNSNLVFLSVSLIIIMILPGISFASHHHHRQSSYQRHHHFFSRINLYVFYFIILWTMKFFFIFFSFFLSFVYLFHSFIWYNCRNYCIQQPRQPWIVTIY